MTENIEQDNSPLVAALHAQIQAVAARPIDMRMLTELEKTCLLARELIVIGKQPNALQKQSLIMGMGEYSSYATPQFAGGQAISAPQETFGVTAIRELVSALATFMPKPPEPIPVPEPQMSFSDITSAILQAKQAGDTELENQLHEALLREIEKLPAPSPSGVIETQALPQAEAAE